MRFIIRINGNAAIDDNKFTKYSQKFLEMFIINKLR